MQLLPLFNALLGTHENATLVLLRAGIAHPTLRDILESLGSFRLKKANQTKLQALTRRWKSASTKRNRIVHGHWLLSIKMVEGPSGKHDHTKSEWLRFYDPANPEILHKIMGRRKDPKMVSAHTFKLKEIEQARADVLKLASDLKAFNSTVRVLAFVNPQPIDIDQSAIQIHPEADDC